MDVGDQKTSISCVEDGISNPETRIHLDYGGSDITQVFHYLLEQIEFPYTDCQPMCRSYDAQLIEKLKTENCHLDLDICGTAEKHFIVSSPGMYVNVLGFFLSSWCARPKISLIFLDIPLFSRNRKILPLYCLPQR